MAATQKRNQKLHAPNMYVTIEQELSSNSFLIAKCFQKSLGELFFEALNETLKKHRAEKDTLTN